MSYKHIDQLNAESMALNLKLNRLNINISKQNQIKVNRKKLPLDFFGKNSQKSDRSSSKESRFEPLEEMNSSRRQFNSERKINATKNLNEFQNLHDISLKREMTAFNNERVMNKLFKLNLEKDNHQNDKRKLSQKNQLKTFRFQKRIHDTDIQEEGLSTNQFCCLNFKSKQFSNIISKQISNIHMSTNISKQNPQILDMNCTFGKKFNKSKCPQNYSLQNTIDLKQSKQIQEEIQRESKYEKEIFNFQREPKQKDERSTEESSQVFYELSKVKRVNHTSQKRNFNLKLKQTQMKQSKVQEKKQKIRRNSLVDKKINFPLIGDRQDRLLQF